MMRWPGSYNLTLSERIYLNTRNLEGMRFITEPTLSGVIYHFSSLQDIILLHSIGMFCFRSMFLNAELKPSKKNLESTFSGC